MNQYFNAKLSLFLTEVSFDTSEENQLLYFQNGYSFKLIWDVMSRIIRWNAGKKLNAISELFTKGHLSLVWYSIDREDQSNEFIFLYKRRSSRLDQNNKEWYQFGTEWASLTYFFIMLRCFWFVNLLSSGSWLIIYMISMSCFHLELEILRIIGENFSYFSGHTIADFLFQKNQNKCWRNCYKKIEVN